MVLVMADDQGWGDMAYQGHPVLKTPNFDAAAAAGLRLDRFYAAAPVCSPTRASVLTGRHPNRMGVFQWGFPIRPQETTLDKFPGHAAWIDGHWKLHRIAGKRGKVTWELYDLATDAAETTDLTKKEPARVERMRQALEAWLQSVTRSLNGEDY